MNIPLKKLLQKMEAEIQNAKYASSEANIRERIQAIKTLCELVLEESEQQPRTYGTTIPRSTAVPKSQPLSIPRTERVLNDEDANGDSLFDF